jgi:hypothetical protein
MLFDSLTWTVLVRMARLVALTAVGASNERHHPPRLHGPRWRTARLAAQVALIDPELGNELRQVTGRIARLARTLEGELHRLRPLETRLEQVVREVEDSSGGEEVDEELFERLAERFGLLRVRPVLQRLEQAHPDAPDDKH